MHVEGCSSEQVPMEVDRNEDFLFPVMSNHPKTFTFPKQRFGDKKPTYSSFNLCSLISGMDHVQ